MTPALLALALAVTAPAAKEKAKPDTDIVGEWVCERSTFAGNPRRPAKDPLHYVFAADGTYTVRRGDRDLAGRRVYGTDPAKAPAEIDMRLEPDQPDGRTYLGIYRVEGDTLTMCVAAGADPRPTAFESTPARPTTLYVFKRVKKSKD